MLAIHSIISARKVVTLLTLAFTLIGCGEAPRFNFEGQWIGYQKMDVDPHSNRDVVRSATEVKVIIKANGRFDMFYQLMPMSGNVSVSGVTATLTPTNTMDPRLDRHPEKVAELIGNMQLVATKDGTVQFRNLKIKDEESVILKRVATIP